MKRAFTILVLATLFSGAGFAQGNSGWGGAKNFVSGNLNMDLLLILPMPGAGLKYERALTDHWSLGGEAGVGWYFLLPYYQIQGRFYPWAATFYAELGVGFSVFIVPTITPAIGWKKDIGNPGAWFTDSAIGFDILTLSDDTGGLPMFKAAVHLGYSF